MGVVRQGVSVCSAPRHAILLASARGYRSCLDCQPYLDGREQDEVDGPTSRRLARREYHKKIERKRRDRMRSLYDELRGLTDAAELADKVREREEEADDKCWLTSRLGADEGGLMRGRP